MKKILLAILALTLFGCTKYYIGTQPIIYQASGYGASVDFYSNKDKRTYYHNLSQCDLFYTENVHEGDSIKVFMFGSYAGVRSKLTIRLGSQIIFEGTPDSTGYLFINTRLDRNYFRLK